MKLNVEIVDVMDLHALQELKAQGNQLFQQSMYDQAIQVYSRVIDKLQECAAADESKINEMQQMETAVRLNRALACAECKHCDVKMLALAEADCTVVLSKQCECVKALYRRAVARERLGKLEVSSAAISERLKAKRDNLVLQDAWNDAHEMHRLEPSNPSAMDLVHRLQAALNAAQKQTQYRDRALENELRRVSLTSAESAATRESVTVTPSAKEVWLALQDEELKLQSAFRSAGKPKKAPKQTQVIRGEISSKTNAVWESLMQEEEQMFKRVQINHCQTTTD